MRKLTVGDIGVYKGRQVRVVCVSGLDRQCVVEYLDVAGYTTGWIDQSDVAVP